jgi:hypothetical protein
MSNLTESEKKMIALALFRQCILVKETEQEVALAAVKQICEKIGAGEYLANYSREWVEYISILKQINHGTFS